MSVLISCLVSCLTAVAAMAETAPAPLGPEDDVLCPAEISSELFDELIGWIAINTSYDVSQTYRSPPEIFFCDTGALVPYDEGELLVDTMLDAVFDLRRRRVYLVFPWSPDDDFDVSVLLHELIHDVQHINRDWDCIGEPELEAYWLQDKWLSEKGLVSNFNWLAILQLSTCPKSE